MTEGGDRTQRRELGWRWSPGTLAEDLGLPRETTRWDSGGLGWGCDTTGCGLDGVKVKGAQRRAGMGEGSIGCNEGDPGCVEGPWGTVMGHWVRDGECGWKE